MDKDCVAFGDGFELEVRFAPVGRPQALPLGELSP